MSKEKGLCMIYDFVLGHILRHPGPHVACGHGLDTPGSRSRTLPVPALVGTAMPMKQWFSVLPPGSDPGNH